MDAASYEEIGDRGHPAGYAWAIIGCASATLLALQLRDFLASANLVLLYLMVVVLVAVWFGRRPGIFSSVLAVLCFDVFLVPPYYSITVADPQYLLTFAAMLTVALIISHLTANLRQQAQVAVQRERRAAALFALSKDLSGALTYEQIAEILTRHLESMFRAKVCLLLPDRSGRLQVFTAEGKQGQLPPDASMEIAQNTYDRQATLDAESDMAASGLPLYLALRAPMRVRGVLVVVPENRQQVLLPELRRLLETCGAQIALAIERVHYVNVAQSAVVAMESERLRNSLLSAISHDVRTPLTTIVGISTALASDRPISPGAHREMVDTLQEEALRMDSLVTNLLDMAKLHAGGVKLNKQWQMLEEVIGSALAMLSRPLANRRIEVDIPSHISLLEFDAVLLERVFCNLLDNAGKYTPQDSTIWIHAERAGDTVLVAVEDNGPGVPKGMEEAIFEKFTRGDPESALIGVGLGLSICRAIVDAHGGRIWAEKRSTGGARFVFSLPVGSPPPGELPPELDQPFPAKLTA
ncbi:MAG: DUF4118 domain-containing protein [Burkholderiales bacterium]|nr:DUF4118 domain-containing protein [Burkholderiales bacterium]